MNDNGGSNTPAACPLSLIPKPVLNVPSSVPRSVMAYSAARAASVAPATNRIAITLSFVLASYALVNWQLRFLIVIGRNVTRATVFGNDLCQPGDVAELVP